MTCPSCDRAVPTIPYHCDCGYIVFACPRCHLPGAVPILDDEGRCANCGGFTVLALRPAGRAPCPPTRLP